MLARGEAVGALAATEPGGGSALPHAVACHARLDNDWWILSGEKLFITNGPIADVVFVLARTSSDPGPFSLSLFAVPSSTAGFEMTRTLDKLGCRSSPTGWLSFRECRVPRANLVGRLDHGYPQVLRVMHEERVLIALGSLALAQATLDDAIESCRSDTGESTDTQAAAM